MAEKIVKTAAQYGIPKKNLVMDALVLTISTGKDNANVHAGSYAQNPL